LAFLFIVPCVLSIRVAVKSTVKSTPPFARVN